MITTIKIKDLIKYLAITIGGIAIIVLVARYFFSINSNNKIKMDDKYSINNFLAQIIDNNNFLACINISIPISKEIPTEATNSNISKVEQNNKTTSRSGLVRILELELPTLEEENQNEEESAETEEEQEKEIEETERAEVKDSYTNSYKSVTIKNLTDIKLTESMLKPDYEVKNKEDIIIFHTHTCESYTPTEANSYKASGNYRTTDLKYSVAKVGDVLAEELEKYKFKVTHNKTKHDYPAYTGSYTRSLETVQNILKDQSDTEIIFDIHRDAVGSKGTYGPTVEINGETVAQLMFVIGTNDGGGKHPNWKNNLKFAIAVQEKANEMYPGLFRSINLRSSTFNQKVSNAASIIEVGATGNTLEEAEASMKYLAKVLNEVLK